MKKETSWGKVANWYDKYLSDEDNYHNKVILPNLLRLMSLKADETVLDLACGSGFLTKVIAQSGTKTIGVDVSKELIEIAKKEIGNKATFFVSSADDLSFLPDQTVNKIAIVLAIQNIEPVKKMLSECHRVLETNGKMYIVMNHPAFRIPKNSSWQWDEKNKSQYRRVVSYLSESKEEIEMHPGEKSGEKTISFHRPLQYYFKLFTNESFTVSRLEEWISHKKSIEGPRQKEEDRTRKEIPLFLFIELSKK